MHVNVFDLETTGLEKAHDVPLQFAAIVYDDKLDEIERVNFRGRPPRHVLPGPTALVVTNQRFSTVVGQELSHYDFIGRVQDHFDSNAPAIITSYNGLNFDEEMLRHSFYGTLRPPYTTQFNGNQRCDIMRAAHAACVCAEGSLQLTTNAKGKRSFRLEDLAPANGFQDHNAHDALGDVHATMHLANVLRAQAPDVWQETVAQCSKDDMHGLMREGSPVVLVEWNYYSDGPQVRALLPITVDDTNPNEWLCVNLDGDTAKILSLTPEQLVGRFLSVKGVKDVFRVKANAQPLVYGMDSPAVAGVRPSVDPSIVAAIQGDAGFADRLREAANLRKAQYDDPEHFREQLYSRGFFPATADVSAVRAFHLATPEDRYDIVQSFTDPRARELGLWLIGSEWPDTLPTGERQAYEDALQAHLFALDAKWTTVSNGLEEIAKLRADRPDADTNILDEYEAYLLALRTGGVSMLMAAE